jgi:hypothetical protein
MIRILHLSLVGMLLLSCTSCGQQAKTRETVRGHVTFKGAFLSGGTIVYTPDVEQGGSGPLAVGEIKTDGSYTLLTANEVGAPSGPYRVSIASEAPIAPHPSQPNVALPRKYSDPAQSGLKRQIKAGVENVIDFNLE